MSFGSHHPQPRQQEVCQHRRRCVDPVRAHPPAQRHKLKALESLLLKMFSADELRRFVRYLPGGEAVSGGLPGQNASPVAVATSVVHALEEHGYLGDAILWECLVAERQRRRAEIDVVRALFAQTTAAAPASPAVTAAAGPPSVLTIVFASASPAKADRLRVDKEFREILEKLRGARYRDRLKVIQLSALRFEDLRTALMEHEPHVLHLSSHGEDDGSLKFESATEDGSQAVSKKNVLKLLRALRGNLRLVVFNACKSAALARDVAQTIGLSIGMQREIFDSDAVEFSVAFYEALAFGKSAQTAFDVALAGLDADEEIPQLFPADDQDPEHKRQQPLVAGPP